MLFLELKLYQREGLSFFVLVPIPFYQPKTASYHCYTGNSGSSRSCAWHQTAPLCTWEGRRWLLKACSRSSWPALDFCLQWWSLAKPLGPVSKWSFWSAHGRLDSQWTTPHGCTRCSLWSPVSKICLTALVGQCQTGARLLPYLVWLEWHFPLHSSRLQGTPNKDHQFYIWN